MSWLVRLYPPSWRKRYGRELDALVEQMPGRMSVALDLIVGAAIAYREVVGANRVLSAAGAYLHGLCVAVLVQAIVFVSLVFVGQRSAEPTELRVGPVDFATVVGAAPWVRELYPALLQQMNATQPVFAEAILVAALVLVLLVVVAAPRMLRTLK